MDDGTSALFIASKIGHIDMVRLLIENDADIDIQTNNSWSSLIVACDYNHIDIVRILISSGASIVLINDNGYSALEIAHIRGHKYFKHVSIL